MKPESGDAQSSTLGGACGVLPRFTGGCMCKFLAGRSGVGAGGGTGFAARILCCSVERDVG